MLNGGARVGRRRRENGLRKPVRLRNLRTEFPYGPSRDEGGGGDRGCGGVVLLIYPGSGNRCERFGGGRERVGWHSGVARPNERVGRRRVGEGGGPTQCGRGRALCTVGVVRRTGRTGPVHVNKPPAHSIPKGNKRVLIV